MRRKRIVPAHIEERVVDASTLCDGCGADLGKRPPFNMTEVTIEAKIGDYYPEGDCRTFYTIDLCGDCFLSRAVPAMRDAGLVVRETIADTDDRVLIGGGS